MKGLLLSAVTLVTAISGANAQTPLGFRLLDFDGRNIVWTAPTGIAQPTAVTYAFVTTAMDFPEARNCRALGPSKPLLERSGIAEQDFRREVRAAFDMWEAVANIRFTETTDEAKAGILIGGQIEPVGRAFANVSYKGAVGERRMIDRSLICLNPEQRWKIGFDGNLNVYDVRYTIAHEIGHAIGLDHPAPTGQLMSYRYDEKFRSLQPGDVAGAVTLYGAHATPVVAGVAPSPAVVQTISPLHREQGAVEASAPTAEGQQ